MDLRKITIKDKTCQSICFFRYKLRYNEMSKKRRSLHWESLGGSTHQEFFHIERLLLVLWSWIGSLMSRSGILYFSAVVFWKTGHGDQIDAFWLNFCMWMEKFELRNSRNSTRIWALYLFIIPWSWFWA